MKIDPAPELPETAEQNLRIIRRLMERATIYRAVSAPTAAVGGGLTLIGCCIWGWLLVNNAPLNSAMFALLWGTIFAITILFNTLFLFRKAPPEGTSYTTPSMRLAFISLLPAFLAGGILTLYVFFLVPFTSTSLFIVTIWQCFYGLGLLATQTYAPRSLVVLGWIFLFSAVMLTPWLFYLTDTPLDSPRQSSLVLIQAAACCAMASTFGLFHLIYAAMCWSAERKTPPAFPSHG